MSIKSSASEQIIQKLVAGLGAHKEKPKHSRLTLLVQGDSKVKFDELQAKTDKEFHKELALVVNGIIDDVYKKLG